ncbi:tail assembly chaperone [Vibrio phage K460]
MLFSEQVATPKVINGTKYRSKKWGVLTTTTEAFKLIKVITPAITVMSDLKMGKSGIQSELDEIYQEQFSNEFAFTQAFAQVRELLEEDHFLDLQHKLLSSLEVKDEEKDEWVVLGEDWASHLSKEEYEGDYLDLLWYTAEVSLVNFILKQRIFRSAKEMVSPILAKMGQSLKESVEKVSSEVE